MSDDVDYQELVQENIADIKERVQDGDLDPEAVLEAEQENKNRVTLVEWLEERIAEETRDAIEEEVAAGNEDWAGDGDEDGDTAPYTGDSGGLLDRIKRLITGKSFVAGLLVGVVLVGGAAAVGLGGGSTGAVSTAQAESQLNSYFADSGDALQGTEITVTDVSRMENADMYEATLAITATVANRSITQNRTAALTPNARYLFLGQRFDTSVPFSQQLQQPTAGAQ